MLLPADSSANSTTVDSLWVDTLTVVLLSDSDSWKLEDESVEEDSKELLEF